MAETGEAELYSVRNAKGVLDPEQLGDPVALRTSWVPIPFERTRPYRLGLVVERVDRLELGAAWPVQAMCAGVTMCGLALGGWAMFAPVASPQDNSMMAPLAGGCVLVLLGLGSLSSVLRPFVFDKTNGRFGRGRLPAGVAGPHGEEKSGMLLERIHAMQVLFDDIYDASSYSNLSISSWPGVACQLNLVLDDGERVHLLRSRRQEPVMEVATTISRFLGKPIWDAR